MAEPSLPTRDGSVPDEGDLEREVAALVRRQEWLEQVQREVAGSTFVGRSRDRLVTVRARGGDVTDVEIEPGALEEHDERSLATAVLDALGAAAAAARRALQEALAAEPHPHPDPRPHPGPDARPAPPPAPPGDAGWRAAPVAAEAAAAWASAAAADRRGVPG